MSLDKAIQHGKEHRKPYYKSGRFDKSCRPHGGCPWCRRNRLHKEMKHGDYDLDICGVSGRYHRGYGYRGAVGCDVQL